MSVVLNRGDFAIFEVDYRCGSQVIVHDFEALELLDHILVPAAEYDPTFTGPWTELLPRAVEKNNSVVEIRAPIDQPEVARWYEDFKRSGVSAYITSHYGEARAQMISAGNNALGQHMAMLMDMAMRGEFAGMR